MELNEITKNCHKMRRLILDMGYIAPLGAHFGAALSAVEIFAVLYGGVMNFSTKMSVSERDILVVGKGHCVLSYYAALMTYGFMDEALAETFDQDGSNLQGHPAMDEGVGIEFSAGSLGMALSQGVGVALSRKMRNHDSRVYVILGDGECQEGAIWEAAMSAAHFKLDNLVVVVDRNHLQYDGNTENVMSLGVFDDKWTAFGFEVRRVDGHDVNALCSALANNLKNDKPLCVIADTVKGKGVSFMEGNPIWHNRKLQQREYEQALEEWREEDAV
ncbi:MAG: transketolase [Eubacterium sp.]|nr:transketolase [Eubacterium sp.]